MWGKLFGDGSQQKGFGIAATAGGQVALSGYFSGSVDFGCGPLTTAGLDDAFLTLLGP